MKEEIPPHVGLIMGCLVQKGSAMLPSDFMAQHRDQFAVLEMPFPNAEDVDPRTRAVIAFDIGMRAGEELGLIETTRDAGLAKWVRLTKKGVALT